MAKIKIKSKGGKLKSRKVAVKRFKVTKTGKVIRKHSATTHLGRKNDSDRRNRNKQDDQVQGKFAKKVKSFIIKSK
jgi:large subunit ribosomal protein L35